MVLEPMKILIVEDEAKLARTLKQGLEQAGFVVDTADNGADGFDLASEGSYDVIVLDWMLPEMDGLTVCRNLRRQENLNTPILMLTAKNQVDDKTEGLDNGADDYLSKPFAFSELVARIKALARRKDKPLSTILKTDGLMINPQTMEASRYGQRINLTKKELALLEYLVKHKGQIVTKEQIITHVWPHDTDILPNTVEAYIGFLRKKIDKPFPNQIKLIETVRGFGYKIKHV